MGTGLNLFADLVTGGTGAVISDGQTLTVANAEAQLFAAAAARASALNFGLVGKYIAAGTAINAGFLALGYQTSVFASDVQIGRAHV